MLELCCHQECEFIYISGNVPKHKRVIPRKVYWGICPGERGDQWVLEALDLDRKEIDLFALKSISVPDEEIKSENTITVSRNGQV